MDDKMKTVSHPKFRQEMRKLFFYTCFFALFFSTIVTYTRLLLDDFSQLDMPYGYSIIEALIFAKIILIGESFNLGEKYAEKPLIIPVLYKTLMFCLLYIAFKIIEECITGFLHGKDFVEILSVFRDKRMTLILAKAVLTSFVFVLFFAFEEIGRMLGPGKLVQLFFKSRSER